MAIFKSLLAVTVALVGIAHAAPRLESRQVLPPAGWNYIGCWSDNPAARTLRTASFTDPTSMTIESCIAFCGTRNFNLAGVEFAKECYCSNAMDNAPGPIVSASCSQACVGNGFENCGGPRALGVYRQII